MVDNKCAKKTRPEGNGWRISICAVIFFLLAATCFAPSPNSLGTSDSIHMHGFNGSPNLAIQNGLVGSSALSKALRTAGNLSHIVHCAKIAANDLTVIHFLPRTIELNHVGFPTSNFLISEVKVRAPPLRLSASAL